MKKGISVISGVTSPTVGEKMTYHISEWYPNTPLSEREKANVTWELFKKRSDGRFTTTHVKKKGDSSFTFGESSAGETYRLEAYLYQPEGGGLIITPKASRIPKICKVDLTYVDDSKGSVFSFTEKLRAKAHCVNMFNKEILFTLWEDDAKGSGHNASNKLIDTKKAKVDLYGNVVVDFMLTKALMKKAMQGETDIRELEFYVTVEYYRNKKHTTANVDIQNPLPTENTPPSQPTGIKKAKGSPAEEKPKSKKEESGLLNPISETLGEIWDWVETQGTALRDKPHTIEIPEGKSPAIVGKTKVEHPKNNTETNCICKQYDLIWGNKVSCDFRKKVVQICAELWGESKKIEMANGLMAVMYVETRGSFKSNQLEGYRSLIPKEEMEIKNFWKEGERKSSRAVGLIQFTQDALVALGQYHSNKALSIEKRFDELNKVKLKFAKMSELVQLDYVKKYFELGDAYKKFKSAEDIYLHVFAPKGVAKEDNYPLYERHSLPLTDEQKDENEKYIANKSVDIKNGNNDGKIQRSEILARYKKSFNEGNFKECKSFICPADNNTIQKTDKETSFYIYKSGNIKYLEGKDLTKIIYFVETTKNSNEFKRIETLDKNSFGYVKFPDSGTGFNRYGGVDKGGNSKLENVGEGDHYLLPETAAALFGLISEISEKNGRYILEICHQKMEVIQLAHHLTQKHITQDMDIKENNQV
ncbi:hypothetical protein [Flavobacterium davisii]|uniref:Uncharacterized protein n=1 Tax=Flavobacterium columnare TaxID=996 RepID=A0A8G0KX35_9FLAO|nr:hypothetical protein [Flavobacterium davisii]QYS88820.1 hypothetical protein JJC05_15445 [Flavobacterium davisii]